MTYGQAIILAVIEGFSEFLPISSTGHLIITSSVLGIAQDEFTKMFTVCIQFGAILSVVVLYWKRFSQSAGFYFKLLVAFLPAAVVGGLFGPRIDLLLENVFVVAVSLFLGGIVFLFIDRWFMERPDREEEVSYRRAFLIGCFQTIAMVPGVSRAGATIIGGLTQNLTRKTAAEFSFFLAVPTMFAAACYKMITFCQGGVGLDGRLIGVLFIGNLVAFGVALVVIKTFMKYLTRHGFKIFGYYRIALGLTLIGLHLAGVPIRYF